MSRMSHKEKENLPESAYAFPREHKEPLTDARHVRDAIARFDQVSGVANEERDEAWKRILQAARRFDVEVREQDWRELFIEGSEQHHACQGGKRARQAQP